MARIAGVNLPNQKRLEILGVKDVSPQAHNGVRQKKRRRV